MPPCCSRFRLLAYGLGFLAGAALLTWSLFPNETDQRQASRRVSPGEETHVRSDVPPGTPANELAGEPKPERVAGEDNLPIKIRPIKGSLLNFEEEPMVPGAHGDPAMI